MGNLFSIDLLVHHTSEKGSVEVNKYFLALNWISVCLWPMINHFKSLEKSLGGISSKINFLNECKVGLENRVEPPCCLLAFTLNSSILLAELIVFPQIGAKFKVIFSYLWLVTHFSTKCSNVFTIAFEPNQLFLPFSCAYNIMGEHMYGIKLNLWCSMKLFSVWFFCRKVGHDTQMMRLDREMLL